MEESSSHFDVVAMAASAGGLEAIRTVLRSLPKDFPCPVVVVQHLDPRHESLMSSILSRGAPLKCKDAEQGERLLPGVLYMAPANHHLLINPDMTVCLTQSELVHFLRPSADLLFESVAATFKERAIAVVLSGTGSDGSMGVRAIKKMGGVVIAQDKAGCSFFGMPGSAIETGCVDFVSSLSSIGELLVKLILNGVES